MTKRGPNMDFRTSFQKIFLTIREQDKKADSTSTQK